MCAPSSAAARLPQYNVQLLFPNATSNIRVCLFRIYHQIPCAEAEILAKGKKLKQICQESVEIFIVQIKIVTVQILRFHI
jgi:hypothetical protein